MALFGVGVSLAGGVITLFIVNLIQNSVTRVFLNGVIFVIPIFAVYLAGIYINFKKLGFNDAHKKIYNLNFIILTLILLLMFVLPSAVMSNAYSTFYLDDGHFINFRAIFSFNVDLEIVHYSPPVYSPGTVDFNIAAVVLKTMIAFAIETAVAAFGYMRGKKMFAQKHMARDKDYRTDEFS
jgi:hypothetical protein